MRKARRIEKEIESSAVERLGTLAVDFATENFTKEALQGPPLRRWKPRKTTDQKGRDLTRYKRGRRAGKLTKFGKNNEEKALLVKGNDMRQSLIYQRQGKGRLVFFATSYAPYHNFGNPKTNLPARPFLKATPILQKRFQASLRRSLQHIIKKK